MNVRTLTSRLTPVAEARSRTVGLLLAQLADVNRKALEAARGLGAADLAWQPGTPAPGMAPAPGTGLNTIGMLLAHIAVSETHLTQVGLLEEADGHVQDVLGITVEDEGLPLPEGAAPSAALAGRELAFYAELVARAEACVRAAALPLSEDDLATLVVRPPREDGTQRVIERRWVLHHMVEHTAAHVGQIQLIRHLLKLAR